jgi:hypothetical protein
MDSAENDGDEGILNDESGDGEDTESEGDGDMNNDDDEEEESGDDDDNSESDGEFEGIADEFIRNFHTGDYDAEFDNALSYDRSVTLPTRPTHASYNKPDNWRERNRIGLERMQRLLQSYINCVSKDENIVLDLRHNSPWGQLRENEEPIVWHDLILDQLWNKLEATFDASKQHKFVADIGDIHIQNVEMKKERIAALVAIFQEECTPNCDESTKYINFDNANLCGEGIIFLSKLVNACSELQIFCLHHNRIDNMESARCLSRSLKLHSSIKISIWIIVTLEVAQKYSCYTTV